MTNWRIEIVSITCCENCGYPSAIEFIVTPQPRENDMPNVIQKLVETAATDVFPFYDCHGLFGNELESGKTAIEAVSEWWHKVQQNRLVTNRFLMTFRCPQVVISIKKTLERIGNITQVVNLTPIYGVTIVVN